MKKFYIQPSSAVVQLAAEQMIAASIVSKQDGISKQPVKGDGGDKPIWGKDAWGN